MAAHLPVKAQASLQVDGCAGPEGSEVRQPSRLFQYIEPQMALVETRHRQAAAVDRDAVAQRDVFEGSTSCNLQTPCLRPARKIHYPACLFHNAGEHVRV